MNNLYIYGGLEEEKINSKNNDYIYYINTGIVIGDGEKINDLKRIHQIAIERRDEYISYINSLNNNFINQNLIYDNTISSFFFSDLFNKRTEIFDTYTSICHIIYLKERLLNNVKINNIYLIECNKSFVQSIASIFQSQKIIEKKTINNQNNLLRTDISQLKFFLRSIFQLLIIKRKYKLKNFNKSPQSLFLTRYPLHFDNQFNEDKYGDMVKNNDKYLISILSDGFHQNIKLTKTAKYAMLLSNQEKVILLDYFVDIKNIIFSFTNYIKLKFKFNKLLKSNYYFDKINISEFLKKEIVQSYTRFPRLTMYQTAVHKILKKSKIKKFVFYLHEYSYGRFFNFVIAKYFPKVIRVGFQHGPAARRKLLYYIGNNMVSNSQNDWIFKTPIPNKVMAEDEQSKQVYEEAGYRNIEIMDKVLRLNYLRQIQRENIDKNKILICPGLHDGYSLLNKLYPLIIDNPNKRFILKPHPRSSIFNNGIPVKYKIKNLEIGTKHISSYLENSSEVIFTYSSVGQEAHSLGIKVKIVCLPNKINESPLLDVYDELDDNLIKVLW